MAGPMTLDTTGLDIQVNAMPLERSAFASFGDVIENPSPGLHPAAFPASSPSSALTPPFDNAVPANQGTAIKYPHVTAMTNLYADAPSGRPGAAVASMFVCATRRLGQPGNTFPVRVLERHPYTSQTFVPLSAGPAGGRYLVIVAPSLPPIPSEDSCTPDEERQRLLPGRGLPDVRRLKAFVATAAQAVTYGAGTWHAPMVALGEQGATVDFVVLQFANGVAVEDCQEVALTTTEELAGSGSAGRSAQLLVRIPEGTRVARL